MDSSNPHHPPKMPRQIPTTSPSGVRASTYEFWGWIQRLGPEQAHTVSAGGVDLGRQEVKEERRGWGLPGRSSLEPSADAYLLAITHDYAVFPPLFRLPTANTRQALTRLIRSKSGRDTPSPSQACPSCEMPSTQTRCWLGHHTHTLSGIPGQAPS